MAKMEWLLGMAIADFGAKPITEITAPMILKCLRTVEDQGHFETAKRLRAKIGGVFRFAVTNGAAESDPSYALKDAHIRPTVTPRAAITDLVGLGGLMRAILVPRTGWNQNCIAAFGNSSPAPRGVAQREVA